MPEQTSTPGIGWKSAVIAAIILALFSVSSVSKNDKQDAVVKNHEQRLDELEIVVRGMVGKPETEETSHQRRIEELETQLKALKAEQQPGEREIQGQAL